MLGACCRKLDLQVEASKPSNESIAGLPGMTGLAGASPNTWGSEDPQQNPPTYQISVPALQPEQAEPEPEAQPEQGAPFTHPFLEARPRSHSHRKASQGSRKNSRRTSSFKSGERQEIGDSVKFETHSEKMDEMLAAAGFGKRQDPENVFASFCGAPSPATNANLDTAHESNPELQRPMQRQSSRRPVPRPSADEDEQEVHDTEHERPHRYMALSNNAIMHTPGLLSSDASSHMLSTGISDLDSAPLRSRPYSAL